MKAEDLEYDWTLKARCRGVDPEWFFPKGDPNGLTHGERRAKAICTACPVRRECLAYCLEHEGLVARDYKFGIWGGTTPSERRRVDGLSLGLRLEVLLG